MAPSATDGRALPEAPNLPAPSEQVVPVRQEPELSRRSPGTRSNRGNVSPKKHGVVNSVGSALSRVKTGVANKLDALDAKLEDIEDNSDGPVRRLLDSAKEKTVQKVLDQMGRSTQGMLKPAYMPERLCRVADYVHANSWPEVSQTLKESIIQGSSSTTKNLRDLTNFVDHPPDPWAEDIWAPFTYFRAKLLYAMMPADANKFRHMRDPVALAMILIKMTPTYGCNVLIFVLTFLLMDRSDEFQLVGYILRFKSFQFISGLISAATLCLKLWGCLEQTAFSELTAAEAGSASFDADAVCVDWAPGQGKSFPFIMCLEVIRILLLVAAAALLAAGQAFGGLEELFAINEVQRDLADGVLDGKLDRSAKKAKEQQGMTANLVAVANNTLRPSSVEHSGSFQKLVDESSRPPPTPSDADFKIALDAARLQFGVPRKRGGYILYFVAYDLALITLLLLFLLFKSLVLWQAGAPSWLFWTTCYYVKYLWALGSFPYFVFNIPVVGKTLHQAKLTAYDQAGHLAPQLTGVQIKQRMAMQKRKEEQLRMLKEDIIHDGDDAHTAAANIQKRFRGGRARKRGARVLRHILTITTPVGLFVNADTVEKWFSAD